MDTRKGVQVALLLAIGFILHYITPPILFGMKPDFLLVMMFIALILNRGNYRLAVLTGLLGGILSAITSTFPGGQIANIIDKLLTAHCAYLMIKFLPTSLSKIVSAEIVAVIGTLLSGVFFLTAAALIVGLPGSFIALFLAVVLPATLINAIAIAILQPAVQMGQQAVSHPTSKQV